ncbi:MAG: rhomboid family intramembrane serine protease [Verrucomicrobia bacterium]|nr:rhomboid family intramembrane serine protease [Verrucomicrobiota bacterium]
MATYLSLRDRAVFEKYSFNPKAILAFKQYHRMITSGFLHLDWMHFAMNILSLLAFGEILEFVFGGVFLAGIFFLSVIGGNLLALAIHRNHAYCAAGASGGVCGVIFASILLCPGTRFGSFFLPIGIPGWLYGALFLCGGFFAIRRASDGVGHDAHLGGAVTGMLAAAAIRPGMAFSQPGLLLGLFGLSATLIILLLKDPRVVADGLGFLRQTQYPSHERYQRYDENAARREKEASIDAILEKIHRKGMDSLNAGEKQRLEDYSKAQRRLTRD